MKEETCGSGFRRSSTSGHHRRSLRHSSRHVTYSTRPGYSTWTTACPNGQATAARRLALSDSSLVGTGGCQFTTEEPRPSLDCLPQHQRVSSRRQIVNVLSGSSSNLPLCEVGVLLLTERRILAAHSCRRSDRLHAAAHIPEAAIPFKCSILAPAWSGSRTAVSGLSDEAWAVL